MYAQFDEHEILDRDPVELVCLLYGKALEQLALARTLTASDRLRERNEAIARASAILLELQGSLDVENVGEIAANLERLYEYVQQKLAEGLAQRSDAPLDEAAGLLETLAEGWSDASGRLKAPLEPASPAEDEPELAAAGRAWTL